MPPVASSAYEVLPMAMEPVLSTVIVPFAVRLPVLALTDSRSDTEMVPAVTDFGLSALLLIAPGPMGMR